MALHNVENDLALTALVVGTSKISSTGLNTSDTNSLRDAFGDEYEYCFFYYKLFFINNIFQSFYLDFSITFSMSLLKREDIAKVHDQNPLHATRFKALFPLPEEFQCNISVEIKTWR